MLILTALLWGGTGLRQAHGQFSFVHITDLHVTDGPSFVNGSDLNGELAQCYLNEFANLDPTPDFILATGDISNVGDNLSGGMYSSLTQYLYPGQLTDPGPGDYFIDSAMTIPIYFVPGNHDYYLTLIPPIPGAIDNYASDLAPDSDYVITTDSAALFLMRSGYDDSRPLWEDANITSPEGSGISDQQCHWLRNRLAAAGNRRKIIALHHPVVNVAGTNTDGTPYTGTVWDQADGCIRYNRVTFLNICDSNQVDLVLSGHEHQNVVATRFGNVVSENWTDSTRYVQTGTALDRAYRIITASASGVQVSPTMRSCTATEIADNGIVSDFSAFPNPTNGTFQLSSIRQGLWQVTVYNVMGQEVYAAASESGRLSISIDLSSQPKGIYFVKGFNGSSSHTEKVLLQ